LEIKKNRFDGAVGRTALIFDNKLKRFVEITRSDVQSLLKNEITVA